MKYTPEITNKLIDAYKNGKSVEELCAWILEEYGEEVPTRSVIAKLSSLGVYKRKEYLNKRGEVPIKKEEYIERIATLLDINIDLLESCEKVTKTALMLMVRQIEQLKKTE